MSLLAPARRGRTTYFTSIHQMLAAPSGRWTEAMTKNSYGTDGIRATWNKVLKDSEAGDGMVATGDDVLETEDGLAFAVRTGVMG